MSSWASIAAKTKPIKSQTTQITVEYNIDTNSTIKPKEDDIPREKEREAHPRDDFTMTNDAYNYSQQTQHDEDSLIDFTKYKKPDTHLTGFQIELLVHGYFARRKKLGIMPYEIKQMVGMYCWNITLQSMQAIAATHLLATVINEYMQHPQNKCEFMENPDDELDILKYIFIRGGACRDSILLRDIKDIDLVINTRELSKRYLSHLRKYHSKIAHQDKDCKCIFWRRYLNKFSEDKQTIKPNVISGGDKDVDEVLKFESLIVNADYLLNAKFICEIVERSERISPEQRQITEKYFGYHQHLVMKNGINYKDILIQQVEFDIVDQLLWHSYGSIQSLEKYKQLQGVKQVENGLKEIERYYQFEKAKKDEITIPIYPFSTTFMYYDFTINCMHIDLYNVLLSNDINVGCKNDGDGDDDNKGEVEYYWEHKIVHRKYDFELVNEYNILGIQDIKRRVLITPNLNVISKESAAFYFWRLVKTASKFIYKLKQQKWKLDKKHLQRTIKHYNIWFDDEFIKSAKLTTFIRKLLKWDIDAAEDFIDRFHVFRFIHFEKYFISKLDKYPDLLTKRIKNEMYAQLPFHQRKVLNKCFRDFGYSPLYNTPKKKKQPNFNTNY